MRGRGIGEFSLPAAQFCCEPKTAPKNNVKKEGRKERKGRKASKKKKPTKQASRGKELRDQRKPVPDHIASGSGPWIQPARPE